MLHKEWEDLIPFYVNHTLPDAQSSVLEQHISACATCQKLLEEWHFIANAVVAVADGWSQELPPLSQQVRAKVTGLTPANVISMPPPPPARSIPLPSRREARGLPLLTVAAAAVFTFVFLGTILLIGLRGFLDGRTIDDATQQIAWITNTPQAEKTTASTVTSTPESLHSGGTLIQGNITQTPIPTLTFTPEPPTETPVPTLTEIVLMASTEEAGMMRFGGEETAEANPQVVAYYSSSNTVKPGETITLYWEVVGGNRIQIAADFDDDGVYEFTRDNLPLSGMIEAQIPMTDDSIETFNLWTYSSDPLIPTSETLLSVAIQCPYVYFFFGSDCPTGNEFEDMVTVQRFQNGYIFHRSLSSEGLVLFDDGTVGRPGFSDALEGVPPDGLLAPAQELMPFYRAALGWATSPTETYVMSIRGAVYNPSLNEQSVWMSLPDGGTARIETTNGNFNGWTRVQ
jgi:hypothetical protein